MSEQKFEVGQDVMVRGKVSEIMQCDGETMLSVAVKSDCLSEQRYHIGMKPCSVLPAPKGDEYCLTAREAYKLMEVFMMESVCGDSRAFQPFTPTRRARSLVRVKEMLETIKARKEETCRALMM